MSKKAPAARALTDPTDIPEKDLQRHVRAYAILALLTRSGLTSVLTFGCPLRDRSRKQRSRRYRRGYCYATQKQGRPNRVLPQMEEDTESEVEERDVRPREARERAGGSIRRHGKNNHRRRTEDSGSRVLSLLRPWAWAGRHSVWARPCDSPVSRRFE